MYKSRERGRFGRANNTSNPLTGVKTYHYKKKKENK